MKKLLASFAGLLLILGLDARAAGLSLELTPMIGYRVGGSFEGFSGDKLTLDAGLSYGLALDFGPRDTPLKFELLWSRQESGIDFRGLGGWEHLDVAVDQFMFGGIYELSQGRFRETISTLIGASMFSPQDNDRQAFFSAGIGLGAKYYATKNLILRADVRGYCNFVESDSVFISSGIYDVVFFRGDTLFQGEVSLGVSFSF